MKEKLFYFPFYPADWLADTSVLTLEGKGAYITLISIMYLQNDCKVLKRHIPNILGLTEKKCEKLMESIYPLLIVEKDKVTQKKVLEVRKKAEEKSNKARTSVNVRWKKNSKVYTNKRIDKFSSLSASERARKMLNDGHE
jgi:uncharacterized protein YdaU (DUF1376 family)